MKPRRVCEPDSGHDQQWSQGAFANRTVNTVGAHVQLLRRGEVRQSRRPKKIGKGGEWVMTARESDEQPPRLKQLLTTRRAVKDTWWSDTISNEAKEGLRTGQWTRSAMKPRRVREPDSEHRWHTRRGEVRQPRRPKKTGKGGEWVMTVGTARESDEQPPRADTVGEVENRERQRLRETDTERRADTVGEVESRAGIRSCLEHIAENHMSSGKDGKSIFKATKLCEIWSLVYRTLTCPDGVEDKWDKGRLVVKKSFDTPVGVHGFTRAECYTVKVVYDQIKRRPITAYPTLPWKRDKETCCAIRS